MCADFILTIITYPIVDKSNESQLELQIHVVMLCPHFQENLTEFS